MQEDGDAAPSSEDAAWQEVLAKLLLDMADAAGQSGAEFSIPTGPSQNPNSVNFWEGVKEELKSALAEAPIGAVSGSAVIAPPQRLALQRLASLSISTLHSFFETSMGSKTHLSAYMVQRLQQYRFVSLI